MNNVERIAKTIYKDYEGCGDEYAKKVWHWRPESPTRSEAASVQAFEQTVVAFEETAKKVLNAFAYPASPICPCGDCGGNGIGACPADTDGDGDCAACARQPGIHVCVTCKDMPWLSALCFTPHMEQTYLFDEYAPEDAPEWWKQEERGKPDPSTVMRWCQVHNSSWNEYAHPIPDRSPAMWGGCHYSLWSFVAGQKEDKVGECRFVWVERPTALEVTDGTSL